MDNLRRKFTSGSRSNSVESKSVFHTPLGGWTDEDITAGKTSLERYMVALTSFCGAGSTAAGQMAALLHGTQYADAVQQFESCLKEVEVAAQTEVAQVATEFKNTLDKVASHGPDGDDDEAYEADVKRVAQVVGRLMHMHCQFLMTASEAMAPFLQSASLETFPTLSPTAVDTEEASQSRPAAGQLDQSEPSSEAANQAAQSSSTSSQSEQVPAQKSPGAERKPLTSPQTVGSPSGLRKLSSFFFKRTRTGSGSNEVPQSAFYVDIPKEEHVNDNSDKENLSHAGPGEGVVANPDQVARTNETNVTGVVTIATALNNLNIHPGATDMSKLLPGLPNNGRLATQEELDSVIDLLSGCQRAPMQAIPENVPSHHVSKVVGPHYGNQQGFPLETTALPQDMGYYRNQHRRSDGLIGETFPREQKTNTWPYRPQQRSGASDLGTGSMSHTFGAYDGTPVDAEYTRYLAAVKAMKQGQPVHNPMGNQGPWSNGEPGLNRSWPLYMLSSEGADTSGRNWSAVGDSSSCSDESSTGDTPWTMGLDLMGVVGDKRRHSSGEESFPGVVGARVADMRPRSVENLLPDAPIDGLASACDRQGGNHHHDSLHESKESKSTNTWPPKQPWAKCSSPGGLRGESLSTEGSSPHPGHPPLTMQWSDPLTNRPLSTWGTGRCDTHLI